MTGYDECTGPPVIWRFLFAFMFLEYLNTYICFIFFSNILVFKLLFFIVFTLSLHVDELMRVFPFFDASQCAAKAQLLIYFKISSMLQFSMRCNTVAVGRTFGFLLDFFVILYFSYILLNHGDIESNAGPKRNCSTGFFFVIGI